MHTQKSDFSVMTLNLRFGLAADGPNAWQYRLNLLPHLFASYPTDFIACQEANDFQVEDLNAILEDYNVIGLRQAAPSFWQNTIIFYKNDWVLQDRDHFYLSPTPNIPSRLRASQWPYQCIVGTFRKPPHQITCINTHFDSEKTAQLFSAELIKNRWLQRSNPLPAVLLGDFNAPIDSELYEFFGGQTTERKIKDFAFKSAFDIKPIGTHHGFSGEPDDDCIDWILHTQGVKPLNAAVITDHVNGSYYSDHFPVVAEFSFT